MSQQTFEQLRAECRGLRAAHKKIKQERDEALAVLVALNAQLPEKITPEICVTINLVAAILRMRALVEGGQ